MYQFNTLLLTILLISIIGCENKKTHQHSIPIENTTEILTQKKTQQQVSQQFKLKKQKNTYTPVVKHFNKKHIQIRESFKLINQKEKVLNVTIFNEKVTFHTEKKPIVLIQFFASWCPPCLAQIPYLNDLEEKYSKDLLIVAVPTHDKLTKTQLTTFINKYSMHYFVSKSKENDAFSAQIAQTLALEKNFSIPLTVIYLEGKYFTHYENSVPIEMIEYDIEQAKKQLKLRS